MTWDEVHELTRGDRLEYLREGVSGTYAAVFLGFNNKRDRVKIAVGPHRFNPAPVPWRTVHVKPRTLIRPLDS